MLPCLLGWLCLLRLLAHLAKTVPELQQRLTLLRIQVGAEPSASHSSHFSA